jgi:hypothetical protein
MHTITETVRPKMSLALTAAARLPGSPVRRPRESSGCSYPGDPEDERVQNREHCDPQNHSYDVHDAQLRAAVSRRHTETALSDEEAVKGARYAANR